MNAAVPCPAEAIPEYRLVSYFNRKVYLSRAYCSLEALRADLKRAQRSRSLSGLPVFTHVAVIQPL